MVIFIGALFEIWIVFAIIYYLFLYCRNSQNKSLILDQSYMQKLFIAVKNANIVMQCCNDNIAIEDVKFLKEDFKSEMQKIDWKYVEKELLISGKEAVK